MKNREKSLAERDRDMIRAYMRLCIAGQEALEAIASGNPVNSREVLDASSSFRTSVKNRHKAAKKKP